MYDEDHDDPEYDGSNDCEQCTPTDGSEPSPFAHCCGCGADGSSQFTDCTC
ncbi:hypothetical protein ACFW9N_18950 [Streptomyces sp. NPDC059496]|uniref:hypothetical protein n=1 Tax=Streptomyces sp. NPDC059496 TaxID=3346851 RepID=UPI0036AA2281